MPTDTDFVHLHVHTDYSLLDGCCRSDRLCQRAEELGMKALAITDHGVLFGLADFYKKAAKTGVKPLLGCEVYLVYEDELATTNEERKKQDSYHMGLLARNFEGYQNLTKLVSAGHVDGFYRNPRISLRQLAESANGLIGFSGCLAAVIPQFLLAGQMEKAREACARFIDIFGKEFFFIELMDHGIPEQRAVNKELIKLAAEFCLKIVATNDVHYVKDTDWQPHDALLCIQTGARLNDEKRMRYDSNQFYLKSREEMEKVFAEVPESITNTCGVAEMCEVKLPFGEDHYPVYEKPIELSFNKDVVNFERILDLYVEKKNEILIRDGKEPIALSVEERQKFKSNGLYLFELCKQGVKERYGVDYDEFRKKLEVGGQDSDNTLVDADKSHLGCENPVAGSENQLFYAEKSVSGSEKSVFCGEKAVLGGCEAGVDAEGYRFAKKICEQLDYELAIITGTGFVDYFLIVWDFIKWARDNGIPVGPGRGSGAGCMVAYVLKITDIDPFRFGLLFERMLNLERVSPPDFDVDFCMRRRDDVVDFVRNKYGHDRVANIITFGTFGAKMIVRDLARVNDLDFASGDRLAKMIPDDLNISLEKSLEKSSELKSEVNSNATARAIIEHGLVIEGMVRNTGKHACGVIIADQPITNLIPVTVQKEDRRDEKAVAAGERPILTTQYPKGPSEELGLLKMDFLGLKTLTVIDDAQKNIRECRNAPAFDIEKVSLEDARTFKLLGEAKTVGVFQLESGGMQTLCRQLEVNSIDEIVALIALYRPGPMQFIPQYIKGKKDPSIIEIPHPLLEELVKETYGILVYQEQVMQCAQIIAGYTLGNADILRRAMGKKIKEVMEQQKLVFIEGAKRVNDIPEKKASEIFAILMKFAEYGFNKSHSAAYAMLSYRTAYLKANYPCEFMAALLSSELGNADKVSGFVAEAESMGIDVLGPDINESRINFTPIVDLEAVSRGEESPGRIRFGMAAIKGVGDIAAEHILAERDARGPFKDFPDFAGRVDGRAVNKRVMECLIKTGAFDFSGIDRGALLEDLERILHELAASAKDRESGQESFFDMLMIDDSAGGKGGNMLSIQSKAELLLHEKLNHEKELLGFYVSGHPMNQYRGFDTGLDTIKGELHTGMRDREPFRLCGVVTSLQKKLARKDNRPWVIITLSTRRHSYTLNMYADAYEKTGPALEVGKCFALTGTVFNREDDVRLSVDQALTMDRAIEGMVKSITWLIKSNGQGEAFMDVLEKCLLKERAGNVRPQVGLLTESGELVIAETPKSLSTSIVVEECQQLRKHLGCAGFLIEAPAPELAERKWGKGR